MKKVLFILIIALTLLSACGSESLIQEDLQKDVDQLLAILDEAYEDKRDLTDEEDDLLDSFTEKYEVGQFRTSDDAMYEMNDREKVIVHTIKDMSSFTSSEETLASEEDMFTDIRNETKGYLEGEEIPDFYKDFYPTYEVYSGIHPQVQEDANEIIKSFDPLVNGEAESIDSSDMVKLDSFLGKYDENEFKVEDKLYLLNDEGWNIYYAFTLLKEDVHSGGLTYNTKEEFNQVKTELGL